MGLSETVSRQGARLEQAITDLRQDMETTVKVEVRESIAGMEARLEDRHLSQLDEFKRTLDALLARTGAA